MSEELERDAARLAYENAGREISQSFDVLNVNMTLAAGTLAALLTVLAAGELFKVPPIVVDIANHQANLKSSETSTLYGIPRFSDISILLIAGAIPLIVRFFIRASIGYQQLLRFNEIQRKMWLYLTGDLPWANAKAYIDVYIVTWRSPERMRRILWGSFQYGFATLSLVMAVAFAWALITAPGTTVRLVGCGVVLVGILIESITLPHGDRFKTPTAAETARLKAPAGGATTT